MQREIVDALEKQDTTYIVLTDRFNSAEPNESSRSSGVTILDAYIGLHYVEATSFGHYTILKRLRPASSV